jgi:L-lactate dehydrogenase complex protein LldG
LIHEPRGRTETAHEASGRDRILGRISRALETRATAHHPGDFPGRAGALGAQRASPVGADLDLFDQALRRSGGEVLRFERLADAAAWLQGFAATFASVAVAPRVPALLRPGLPEVAAADAQLGVSIALTASAMTGTLLLDSREGRSLQLLPPVHLVWLDAGHVRPDLDSALEYVRGLGPLPAVIALHSGPSKSADIGRIVVTGVHGPGRLIAAVCEEPFVETLAERGT